MHGRLVLLVTSRVFRMYDKMEKMACVFRMTNYPLYQVKCVRTRQLSG